METDAGQDGSESDRWIILIGFMGAGKTEVGRALAQRLACRFVDLDRSIEERQGQSIPKLFELYGEAGFRVRETEALKALSSVEPGVLATGGGTPTIDENRARLAEMGRTVWLNPPFEVILDRLKANSAIRPLYSDPERARRLFERRERTYRQADLRVDIGSGENVGQVAARIALELSED